jgi:class III poly(R)-hydroxyalkanoic acid synthase PhaE subunit
MMDRDTDSGAWIADWIAEQRRILAEQSRAAEARQRDGARSFAAGAENEGSSRPADASAAPESDLFNVGSLLMSAWTSARLWQTHFADQFADLLRRIPPVGLVREHTEAWRELAEAHAECTRLEGKLREELTKVQLAALDLLEKRVRERPSEEPIDGFRKLYDLWVECGEQTYAGLAHSEAYSKLQAELGNASMRLKNRLQTVLEHALKHLDLPTRSELNTLHRQVRELRLQLEELTSAPRAKRPARKQARKTPKGRKR